MKYLLIINEGPYGNEKPYNALRLSMTLQKEHQAEIQIFLMGDAVVNAMSGQKTPDGYYNMERMLKSVLNKGGIIKLCGTCMEARGITEETIVKGCQKSTMVELAALTDHADRVIVF